MASDIVDDILDTPIDDESNAPQVKELEWKLSLKLLADRTARIREHFRLPGRRLENHSNDALNPPK